MSKIYKVDKMYVTSEEKENDKVSFFYMELI